MYVCTFLWQKVRSRPTYLPTYFDKMWVKFSWKWDKPEPSHSYHLQITPILVPSYNIKTSGPFINAKTWVKVPSRSVEYWIHFEWNKHRCTYLVEIWIHCCTSWNWRCMENTLVYIQSQQWKRNVRIALGWQLTGENWENYNNMRNCHLSELMCEVSFHCLLRA